MVLRVLEHTRCSTFSRMDVRLRLKPWLEWFELKSYFFAPKTIQFIQRDEVTCYVLRVRARVIMQAKKKFPKNRRVS